MPPKPKRKKRGSYRRRNSETPPTHNGDDLVIRQMDRCCEKFLAGRGLDPRVTKYIMFDVQVTEGKKWIRKTEFDLLRCSCRPANGVNFQPPKP